MHLYYRFWLIRRLKTTQLLQARNSILYSKWRTLRQLSERSDSHSRYSGLYTLMNVCRCLKRRNTWLLSRQTPPRSGPHICICFIHIISKRGIGPSAQSYIRDIDVTRATSLSSADVRMTVFMSFCIRTNSFIVWAVNPRNSSDNITVRVIPFTLSSVLQ